MILKTLKIITTFFAAKMLSACILSSAPVYDLPYSYDENAPDIWKLAWEHGCKSGLSAYGNNFYKTFYKLTQDVDKMKNPTYLKGWKDSFNHCRSYVNRYLAGESRSSEEIPAVIGNSNIDFKGGNKRDDPVLLKAGFTGTSDQALLAEMFNFTIPGWGETARIVRGDPDCDWLNRCGADKPQDPMEAFLGF